MPSSSMLQLEFTKLITGVPRYTSVNDAMCQILGYTREELLASNPSDLLDEESRARFGERIRKLLAGQKVDENVEFKVRAKDGREICAVLNVMFIYKDGLPDRAVVVAHDVTERKKAEKALRESEQRWATTLESIGDAVIATDMLGKITYMNGIAEKLTGWSLTEASQKPMKTVFDIINEETNLEVENPVTRVLKEGTVVGLANHTVLNRKDGTKIPIDDSGAPIKDKDGKIVGVVLVFRDITERKKSQEALKDSEERYRHLLQSAPTAIYGIDFTGPRFTSVNDAVCLMTGYSKEELLAANPFDFLDDESVELFRQRIRKALAGEKIDENVEYKAIHKDGHHFWVTLNIKLLDKDGKVYGAQVVAHDITERKKIADSLQTSMDRLYSILSNMRGSILLVSDDGHVEFANQSFCNYFGFEESPLELKGVFSDEVLEKIKNSYMYPDKEIIRIKDIVASGKIVTGEEVAIQGNRACMRDFIPLSVDGKICQSIVASHGHIRTQEG